MTDKAIIVIRRIGDWYLMDHGTYMRIYGAVKPPHLLCRFISNKLVLQEVAYHTIMHGVGGMDFDVPITSTTGRETKKRVVY
jgi:hypothetical protein